MDMEDEDFDDHFGEREGEGEGEGEGEMDNFDFSSSPSSSPHLTHSFGDALPPSLSLSPSSSSSSSLSLSRSLYSVLSVDEIRRKCEEMISELCEIGSLSASESALVLRVCKWDMEKVLDILMDRREDTLRKVCVCECVCVCEREREREREKEMFEGKEFFV